MSWKTLISWSVLKPWGRRIMESSHSLWAIELQLLKPLCSEFELRSSNLPILYFQNVNILTFQFPDSPTPCEPYVWPHLSYKNDPNINSLTYLYHQHRCSRTSDEFIMLSIFDSEWKSFLLAQQKVFRFWFFNFFENFWKKNPQNWWIRFMNHKLWGSYQKRVDNNANLTST